MHIYRLTFEGVRQRQTKEHVTNLAFRHIDKCAVINHNADSEFENDSAFLSSTVSIIICETWLLSLQLLVGAGGWAYIVSSCDQNITNWIKSHVFNTDFNKDFYTFISSSMLFFPQSR